MRKTIHAPRASDGYSLLTLEKGLGTLELIAASEHDIGVSELSARLNEPVSVMFRVVRTLMNLGYVKQDPSTKRYSLGLRAWELGERAAARLDIRGVVQPSLDRLTRTTGETASFALVEGCEYCYVATSDGNQPLRAYVERGSRLSLATPSASARTILAFSAGQVVDAVLAGKLKQHTSITVIDPARLRVILEETRLRGAGIVHGENQQQLSAVAAPVHIRGRECIGAIALSGLTLRFKADALKRMVQLVRAEAKDVEGRLASSVGTQRDNAHRARSPVSRGQCPTKK
jgi:DNA-binding IclR family transcriptional regulator